MRYYEVETVVQVKRDTSFAKITVEDSPDYAKTAPGWRHSLYYALFWGNIRGMSPFSRILFQYGA